MDRIFFLSIFWLGFLGLLNGVPSHIYGQNLFSNPGFEQCSELPDGLGQWYLTESWTNVEGGMGFPSPTPDLLHTAAKGGGKLPQTPFGRISAREGKAIAGLSAWNPNKPDFREYLSQRIKEPLCPGTRYELSLYLSNGVQGPGMAGGYGVAELGILFSEDTPEQNGADPILREPQLTTGEALYSRHWRQLRFSFVAEGPYEYITIGNFRNDMETRVRLFERTTYPCAYYFFDAFELKVAKPIEELPTEIQVVDTDTMVSPNRVSSLEQEIPESGLSPVSNCSYYLPNVFSPDGNGINDFFELYSPCIPLELYVNIFDRSGQVVFSSNDPYFRWDGYSSGKQVHRGVYFYLIEATISDGQEIREVFWRGTVTIFSDN